MTAAGPRRLNPHDLAPGDLFDRIEARTMPRMSDDTPTPAPDPQPESEQQPDPAPPAEDPGEQAPELDRLAEPAEPRPNPYQGDDVRQDT